MGAPPGSAGDLCFSFGRIFYKDDHDSLDGGEADLSCCYCDGGYPAAGTSESTGKSGTEKYHSRPVFIGYAEAACQCQVFGQNDQRDREGLCGDGKGENRCIDRSGT